MAVAEHLDPEARHLVDARTEILMLPALTVLLLLQELAQDVVGNVGGVMEAPARPMQMNIRFKFISVD